MNDEQFYFLVGLLRMTSEPVISAAHHVLVRGERQIDAALISGCRPNHLSRAVVQLRKTHEEIKELYKSA